MWVSEELPTNSSPSLYTEFKFKLLQNSNKSLILLQSQFPQRRDTNNLSIVRKINWSISSEWVVLFTTLLINEKINNNRLLWKVSHLFLLLMSYFANLISLGWISFKINPVYLVDSGMTLEFFPAALFQRPCRDNTSETRSFVLSSLISGRSQMRKELDIDETLQ